MSLIQVIEQLGSNAVLQQFNQAELTSYFTHSNIDKTKLEAIVRGDLDHLSDLMNSPVYHCVIQTPAEEQEEPAEDDSEKAPTQQSIVLQ